MAGCRAVEVAGADENFVVVGGDRGWLLGPSGGRIFARGPFYNFSPIKTLC